MEHHFDLEDAEKYGLKAAIILQNFKHWIAKNKADGRNFNKDRFWSYTSMKALQRLFPYMSDWDIRQALEKLTDENSGMLLKGNFNPNGYDRTSWYAFKDENAALLGYKSHLWNSQMDDVNSTNGLGEIHEPIPDKIPDIKPNILSDKAQIDLSESYQLLLNYGVSEKIAHNIVFELKIPPESIRQTIQNGISKQIIEKGFVLKPGYIVKAIKQARREGKIINPTVNANRIRKYINTARGQKRRQLDEAEFNRKKAEQLAALRK